MLLTQTGPPLYSTSSPATFCRSLGNAGYPSSVRPQGVLTAPVKSVQSPQVQSRSLGQPATTSTATAAQALRPGGSISASSQFTPGTCRTSSPSQSRVSFGSASTTGTSIPRRRASPGASTPGHHGASQRQSPPQSPAPASRRGMARLRQGSGEFTGISAPTRGSESNATQSSMTSPRGTSSTIRIVSGNTAYVSSAHNAPGRMTSFQALQKRPSLGAISEISTCDLLGRDTPRLGTRHLFVTPFSTPDTIAPIASFPPSQPSTKAKVSRYISSEQLMGSKSASSSLQAPNPSNDEMQMGPTRTRRASTDAYGGTRAIVGTNAFKIGTMTLKLMPDGDRELALRITSLLEAREELKKNVIQCFIDSRNGHDELDLERLEVFRDLLPGALGVAPATFDDLCSEYIRFDFDGTGQIGMNAAYKLVKFHLRDHHKRLAAETATANVPVKDLSRAGYTIIKSLGEGNQGTAKLVKDRKGRERCIKCYEKSRMPASGVEELRQEFEALKLLQCEFIASVIEIFQDSSFYYLVGEAYHGGNFMTLKETAIEQGVANEDWFRNVFRQCFEALVFMHEQAMMHCDIKEPNLMIRHRKFTNPRVVVIDLGVSRCMSTVDNGMPHGTPGYVPPETLEARKWFPRGDVFSMGVCICQIMADKLPPTGARDRNTPGGIFIEGCANVREIFQATRNRVPPLHLMPEEYPLLTTLVELLLEKKHEKRPSAPQVLNQPWFKQGNETWQFENFYDKFNARSRFASVGITKSFLRGLEVEDEDDEEEVNGDDSPAFTDVSPPNSRER